MGLLALLLAPLAAAEPVPVRVLPAEVTVYPQGALIVREGGAKLGAGPATVLFDGIPAGATDSSVRLSVEGPKGTKFYGVQLRSSFTPKAVEERVRDLQERIDRLEDEKAGLGDAIAAREKELQIIESLARESALRTGSQARERPEALPQVVEGARSVGKRITELLGENRKDRGRQRDLDARIAALRNELSQAGRGSRHMKVAEADLDLAKAGDVAFSLSYTVPAAAWTPIYDLRLESGGAEQRVGIAFAAQVQQTSGEDWRDVKLVVSTARPAETSEVPDPTDWWLDFHQPVVRRVRAKAGLAAPAALEAAPAAAPVEGLVPAEVAVAETERAEYATSFVVGRTVTVLSDGSRQRVPIAGSVHPAKILLVTVPRLAPAAFIEAEVGYEGEQPLLPGPANLFRGTDFVGTTSLSTVGPGEGFSVGFGQDKNVTVERKLVAKKGTDKGGWFTGAERRYRWVTTLKNLHAGARMIEVREQLPRSRKNEIAVDALELSPEPLAEDPAQPGLKRWRIEVPAKGEGEVVFSYRVKFPKGSRVSGLE